MIDFGPFQFASAPRTGTTWVQIAAATAGFGESSKAHVHIPFSHRDGKLRVSCIRHPCDWLRSYYTTIYPAMLHIEPVDSFRSIRGCDFDEYVRQYLRYLPGAIGRMFTAYGADALLKLEELPVAFTNLLEQLGIAVDIRAECHRITPANQAIKQKPCWNPQLYQRVLHAEYEFASKYAYL